MLDREGEVLAGGKRLKPLDVYVVIRLDLVVVLGVNKGQREHALLLQVGLKGKNCQT